jgi:hypothetical protein
MMTDEELIRALLEDTCLCPAHVAAKAADRIEALTAERNEQIEWVKYLADMQIASEAKLAKAMEALRKLDRRNDSLETFSLVVHEIVSTALAEIEGGK